MTDSKRTGVYDNRPDTDLGGVIKSYVRAQKSTIRTHIVAKIVATDSQPLGFDSANQLVSLELQILRTSKDRKDPTKVVTNEKVILKNIPVAFLSSGNSYLVFPISVGDTGTLHVYDRNIQKWLRTGEVKAPPLNLFHDPTSAIWSPDIRTTANKIGIPALLTGMILESPTIKLGENAVQGVARLGDSTSSAPGQTAWMAQAQVLLVAFATLAGLPPPVFPSDFGIISEASTKVSAE